MQYLRIPLAWWLIAGCLLLTITAWSGSQEDVKTFPTCSYCGMDRTQFAHSRMLVIYDDQSRAGTCSLHCLALDLALHLDKTPISILTADYTSKQLIDAEKAWWVLGGTRPPVMTQLAFWSFANRTYAEKFIRDHGGLLATFEEAMQAVYEGMYAEIKSPRDQPPPAKPTEKSRSAP